MRPKRAARMCLKRSACKGCDACYNGVFILLVLVWFVHSGSVMVLSKKCCDERVDHTCNYIEPKTIQCKMGETGATQFN